MMNYCDNCEYNNECELAGIINFCEDCKDCDCCSIRTEYCKAGHDIECNNGFEKKDCYCDEEEGASDVEIY